MPLVIAAITIIAAVLVRKINLRFDAEPLQQLHDICVPILCRHLGRRPPRIIKLVYRIGFNRLNPTRTTHILHHTGILLE